MFDAKEQYLQAQCASPGLSPTGYIPPTKRQQLEQQRFQLQSAIDKVDAAIAALDSHPELEQFIDTLQKAGI
jgi:hypothetical protein